MKYSDLSIKLLAAQELGLIKSNADFYKRFPDKKALSDFFYANSSIDTMVETVKLQVDSADDDEGILCVFDDDFPIINSNVKVNKPYLLFYKGNRSLLQNLNNNVAVIGVINPEEVIEARESAIVKKLVENDIVIVSGLALGCDTVAHKTCIETGGKTIAILPSPINKITPAANRALAKEIVENDGLLLTEYYRDSVSKWGAVGRFIERDRLQAMFSKAIVLIASYREKQGDSGSRHAMINALEYGIQRYVMYNEATDKNNLQFGLNKDILESRERLTKVLKGGSIEEIKNIQNANLSEDTSLKFNQMSMFDTDE